MIGNKIHKIGLLLFLIGFISFLGSRFLEEHVLSDQLISDLIPQQDKAGLLIKHMSINDDGLDAFQVVDKLVEAIDATNAEVIDTYGISSVEIQKMIDATTGEEISFDQWKPLFDSNETSLYKWSKFESYGSWLNGKGYNDKQELESLIFSVVTNVEKYGLIQEKGVDQYLAKQLKYDLVKASSKGLISDNPFTSLILIYGLTIIGALIYINTNKSIGGHAGIKNDNIFKSSLKNRGWLGILLGSFLIVFYIILYFYPEYMTTWVIMLDPVSYFIKGSGASPFFVYGFIYTVAIIVMGIRMIMKYRHSSYQIFRTISVMFFQAIFAFLVPEILVRLNQPYFDFKNIWPLDYDFFFDNSLDSLLASGGIGVFMLVWGIGLAAIGVPVMVYFFGKRWYCSWVCGCGGLAETLGDPFRQQSNKSIKAWKFERISIHSVLVFSVVMTVWVLYTYFSGNSELLGVSSYSMRSYYGAFIGAGFSGVIGTGFYPLMGNRVWCRFGCPLAAYLGIIQRFKSKFRITTNGGQCISCGNCSTYCEMGIDVRSYAQRGENIIRSSCVGCGVCSAVCPRGVLNLENIAGDDRFQGAGLVGNDSTLNA